MYMENASLGILWVGACKKSNFSGALPQIPLGELTALPQTPYIVIKVV